mmetsp:Transcript_35480/g.113357  ORF Transcript_35480/g.113357 Transcript_35480/m.113357 type:complete len:143 (+) Transcript_35480:25-453(+)
MRLLRRLGGHQRRWFAKRKGFKGPKPEGDTEERKDEAYELFRSIIDAPKSQRPKFDAETAAKHLEIAQTYNRLTRKEHDRFNGRLQLKLDLQQFAVKSLPPHMEAHASQHDDVPLPPVDRRWWTWTPPMPGFNPDDHVQEDD